MTDSLQLHELQQHSAAKQKKKKVLELSNSAKDGLSRLLHPLKIPIQTYILQYEIKSSDPVLQSH